MKWHGHFMINQKNGSPECTKSKRNLVIALRYSKPDSELVRVGDVRWLAQGNTVVVVEHRLELIAAADWVIDMGPGGGHQGGQILFTGTPGELSERVDSETARYLRSRTGNC